VSAPTMRPPVSLTVSAPQAEKNNLGPNYPFRVPGPADASEYPREWVRSHSESAMEVSSAVVASDLQGAQ